MLKVELRSEGRLHSELMKGLRCKSAGKTRDMLFELWPRVRGIRETRHRSWMIGVSLQWGLRWCGSAAQETRPGQQRLDAGDSGEVCGKHGTQRQTKALVVRHVVR